LIAIVLAVAMAAGALAGLGVPGMPWQNSDERAKARAELEECLADNDLAVTLGGEVACPRARIELLRWRAIEK
jgi:hypothetical protein